MSISSVSMQSAAAAIANAPRGNDVSEAAQASIKKGVQQVEPSQANTASRQELEKAVEAVQKFTEPMASNLQFTIDEETGIRVVKVVDTSSQEVIRQMPSEEMLQIAKALDRLQGILIKQKA